MTSADEIQLNLKDQIRNPVKWHQSVEKAKSMGVRNFLCIGPGKALANMLRKDTTTDISIQ